MLLMANPSSSCWLHVMLSSMSQSWIWWAAFTTPLTTLFPLPHIFSPSSQKVKWNYFEAIYQTPCHPPGPSKVLHCSPLTLAVVGYYQTPVSLMCKTSTVPDWWRWMMWWFQVSLITQYSGITQCIQCVHHPVFLSFPQVAALKKFIERSFLIHLTSNFLFGRILILRNQIYQI